MIACLLLVIAILVAYIISFNSEIRKLNASIERKNETGEKTYIGLSLFFNSIVKLGKSINRLLDIKNHIEEKNNYDKNMLHETVENISHDFRTPLTALIGYLQLLSKTSLTTRQEEYLEISLNRSAHLKVLVEQFYQLSILDTLSPNLIIEKCEVTSLVTESLLNQSNKLLESYIVPTVSSLPNKIFILTDIILLSRVFDNLISNAARYGTGNLSIHIKQNKLQTSIIFENEITENTMIDADRIFDKFYTVGTRADKTGLGLAIVKKTVETLHGKVSADITDNHFSISIIFADDFFKADIL